MTSRNVPQHCQTTLFGIVLLLAPGTMWRLPVKLTHRMTRDLGGLGLDVFELKAAGRHFRDIGEFKKVVSSQLPSSVSFMTFRIWAGPEEKDQVKPLSSEENGASTLTTVVVGADFVIA